MPDRHWYVYKVDTGREQEAVKVLRSLGVNASVPMHSYRVRVSRRSRRRVWRERPRWPGYVLVEVGAKPRWWDIGMLTFMHYALGMAERPHVLRLGLDVGGQDRERIVMAERLAGKFKVVIPSEVRSGS